MTAGEQRTLITAETFRNMARKGAKADDFADKAVLKAGLVDLASIKAKDAAPVDGAPTAAREIGFILSNANLDREGDSISVPGWDIKSYEENPVVLWAHDHSQLPVGRADKTYVDGSQLKALDTFADAELYPFADTVYRMLQQRFLNACSVGFQPTEWEMSDTGVNFLKQGLLEHSVCPVPAHPEALVIARSKGINTEPLKKWAENVLDGFRRKSLGKLGDGDVLVRHQLEVLRVQADPKGLKFFTFGAPALVRSGEPTAQAIEEQADLLEMETIDADLAAMDAAPIASSKGVVPENVSTKLAPEGESWAKPTLEDFTSTGWGDLTDAEKTAIAGHFAWAKEMPPASFGDLSLPHHDPKTGAVNWAACSAVAARLNQTDLPSGDVAGVKAHMRAHFEAFDKPIPDALKAETPAATTADPASDPNTPSPAALTAYQTMASVLAQVGTAASGAAECVNTLLGTPEPTEGDDPPPAPSGSGDDAASDLAQLDAVLTNCQTAIEGLQTVAEMAQALMSAPPADPPAPAAAEGDKPKAVASASIKRWNQRLSKAFDIGREQIAPADVEEALVARYMDVDLKLVERRKVTIPTFRMGSWLTAIDDELASEGWRTEDVRNLSYEGKEVTPVYEVIELNSTLKSDFLIDGIRFMKRVQNGVEERFALDLSPYWYGMDLTFYGVRESGVAGRELGGIATKAKTINFLKGEAFALCGEFLPKTSEVMDDLFLGQKNAEAITRTVSLINGQRGALENRGMLLMGPPGTGKTLSARILRNVCDCTFIWISSRDFHYAGAFGGITEAFDLARECAAGPDAPASVIVFEDIDNWLGDYTIDLLKTELDGVGRSSGVVTLMTTNYPELLPAALLDRPGRFHDVLRFGLPDDAVRKAMLQKWIADIDEPTLAVAVEQTKGYSGAHIRELARFASIIGEQEALDTQASVVRALSKLAEQRELINQTQTQGSRYRAPADLGERKSSRVALALAVAKAAPAGEAPQVVPVRRTADEAADRLAGLHERRTELASLATSLLAADLTPGQRALITDAQRELRSVSMAVVKEGRVLSSKNEERIRSASALLEEVHTALAREKKTRVADDNGSGQH